MVINHFCGQKSENKRQWRYSGWILLGCLVLNRLNGICKMQCKQTLMSSQFYSKHWWTFRAVNTIGYISIHSSSCKTNQIYCSKKYREHFVPLISLSIFREQSIYCSWKKLKEIKGTMRSLFLWAVYIS